MEHDAGRSKEMVWDVSWERETLTPCGTRGHLGGAWDRGILTHLEN